MRELLVEELRDLYDADKQLVDAFPRLADGATAASVRKLCLEGVDYSKRRIARLEEIFNRMNLPKRNKRCHAMAGLIMQAHGIVDGGLPPALTDAALLAAIQKISHYGIAGYGTARAYAAVLREKAIADLLARSLAEKKDADVEMTAMAEEEINPRAMAAGKERLAGKSAAKKNQSDRRTSGRAESTLTRSTPGQPTAPSKSRRARTRKPAPKTAKRKGGKRRPAAAKRRG